LEHQDYKTSIIVQSSLGIYFGPCILGQIEYDFGPCILERVAWDFRRGFCIQSHLELQPIKFARLQVGATCMVVRINRIVRFQSKLDEHESVF